MPKSPCFWPIIFAQLPGKNGIVNYFGEGLFLELVIHLIEIFHFIEANLAISIQVYATEPVFNACRMPFVLFRQKEANKV
jgi:hypothetical protein